MASGNVVVNLYRSVLRTNKAKLPTPMRVLGDAYAREEFKRVSEHKGTTDSQWKEFVGEWRKYCDMLNGTADLPGKSGYIPDDQIDQLTNEQRVQLSKLKEEAEKLGRGEKDG